MKRWYFPIKRVKQVDNHGCAIASVATVCGVTYYRARAEFFPNRYDFIDTEALCVSQPQMLRVLDRLGFKAQAATDFKSAQVPALLPFSWFPGRDDYGIHCVVWDPFEKRIIDPGDDWRFKRGNDYYLDLWKRSNYQVVLVTGKK